MKLQGEQILVTGADGFIGSHLAEALVKIGCNVRAFVYYNSEGSIGCLQHIEQDVLNEIDIFPGDIRDFDSVREAMSGCNIVFHLAAITSDAIAYHSTSAYVDTNIKGTVNVVQSARDLNIDKLIHTSTSKVYADSPLETVDEETAIKAYSPYSASKIGADQIALSFHNAFSTPVSIIRLFNTYGPRQSKHAMIPTLINQIMAGNRSISLDSQNTTVDFNYIEDTVRGFISIAESDDTCGEIINIGSGFGISIEDTVRLIVATVNQSAYPPLDSMDLLDATHNKDCLITSNTKAKNLLQWSPHYSGIEGLKRGLQYSINWYRNPYNSSTIQYHSFLAK